MGNEFGSILLLSCRALGRGIESAVVNAIKQRFKADPTLALLRARFVPTARNRPADGFYEREGFRLVHRSERDRNGAPPQSSLRCTVCQTGQCATRCCARCWTAELPLAPC